MTKKTKRTLSLGKFNPLQLLTASLFLFGFFMAAPSAWAHPEVTVRFANPVLDCETNTYCVDVEYQADKVGEEIFGSNVRFYYNDQVMEFLSFQDFQGGYTAVAPNPPSVTTSSTTFASNFGFNGGEVLDLVNGAIQLTNESAASIFLPADGSWVKIFQVCFTIDPTQINNPTAFCPSLIWDLEQDPANGGYGQGSDGVVITVVSNDPSVDAAPAIESVEQYNWVYSGEGAAPYGAPQPTVCLNATCTVPPPPQDLPALSPLYKFMLGIAMISVILLVGINRRLF